MSEPGWMPEPDELLDVLFKRGARGAVDLDPLRAKVTTAVEKALAEQEARHRREVLEARLEGIEGYSITLVRSTLEEAARAVCPWCREETDTKGNHDGAVRADPQGVRWVHRIRSRPCLAMRIHDLIAALDGKEKP